MGNRELNHRQYCDTPNYQCVRDAKEEAIRAMIERAYKEKINGRE